MRVLITAVALGAVVLVGGVAVAHTQEAAEVVTAAPKSGLQLEQAMSDMHAARLADLRADLELRIDHAIAEGTLTEEDKAELLAAFDQGQLMPEDLKEKGLDLSL